MSIRITNDSFLPWNRQTYVSTGRKQYSSLLEPTQSVWLSSLNLALRPHLRVGKLTIALLGEFLQTKVYRVS